MSLKDIHLFVLDTLFPIHCLSCRKSGEWLCFECLKKIDILSFQVCPYCEKEPAPSGRACKRCRTSFRKDGRRLPLDALCVATRYKEKDVSRSIHLLKYRFVEELAGPLAEILRLGITRSELPLPDLIIPVPLHKRRLRMRGFNQSELLAGRLSERLAPGFRIPVASGALSRTRYTSPQMKLVRYDDRRENMSEAFRAAEPGAIRNKRILLVDDVATTGATLFECARVLKEAGAREVSGAVIARQEIEK